MTDRVIVEGLSVARVLYDFINREVLPGTGVPEAGLWIRLDRIVHDLAPRNRALLAKRDALQAQIDAWHRVRKGKPFDLAAYRTFLGTIGYLVQERDDFTVDTENVDDEIARIAGPQLVVPIRRACFCWTAMGDIGISGLLRRKWRR
jgi:malate synthase